MKAFLLGLLLTIPAFAETEIISLTGKATYEVGENALLRAQLLTKPDNSNLEFDMVGTLNGLELPIERVTNFEAFSEAKDLVAGAYEWSVTVFIQDKRMAADLKASVQYFTTEIEAIDLELETATDAERIAYLEAQKIKFDRMRSAALSQLSAIRSQVHGPVTFNFLVQ